MHPHSAAKPAGGFGVRSATINVPGSAGRVFFFWPIRKLAAMPLRRLSCFVLSFAMLFVAAATSRTEAASPPTPLKAFADAHCISCHDQDSPAGGLDLTSLAWQPSDAKNFAKWVLVHDNLKCTRIIISTGKTGKKG